MSNPHHGTSGLSAVTLLSSTHGRMRRAQRLIEKKDLKAAVKYGTKEISYNQRGEPNYKYTFGDIVYITDLTSKREITSMAIPGAGLDVQKHPISDKMKHEHDNACALNASDISSWTSHTVIIVDQSGSMRKADVEGGATRSDAVWLTLAVDFVAKQIENKQISSTDVVSIVAMGTNDAILVDRKPHDWLLFNAVVDLLRKQQPCFNGDYLPALDTAERLLESNVYGNCALSLFFLSDGKPSDEIPRGKHNFYGNTAASHVSMMGKRIDRLASRFGRRLSVTTVGFAGPNEDFCVLQKLAERPTFFGSNGSFVAARLNAEALGNAFDSAITSSLQTRSELTAVGGSSQRVVRDVRRKARDTIGHDLYPNKNWFVYQSGRNSWERKRIVYDITKKEWASKPPLNTSATSVALEASFFGEGAERLVREFREIGPDGRFTGEKLVAKESRFQMDIAHMDRRNIMKFHQSFCETQHRAQRLAKVFNKRLETLPGYHPLITPTISFLECSVYMVQDRNLGEIGVLVEKQIDPVKYKKWNDNCGGVDGQDTPGDVMANVSMDHSTLDAIAELDEEDSEDDEEDVDVGDHPIRVEDIPQAFSHFTYRYTKRRLLVCDLQGVLSNSPLPLFEFTDPVIHFRSHHGKGNYFGRTDRGMDGVVDFFRTHKCGELCRMLNRRWIRKVEDQQRSSHLDGLEVAISNLNVKSLTTRNEKREPD